MCGPLGWHHLGMPQMMPPQWPTHEHYPQYPTEPSSMQQEPSIVSQGMNSKPAVEVNALYYNNPYLQQYQQQQGVQPPPMYPTNRSTQQLWQPPPHPRGVNPRYQQQQQFARGPPQQQQRPPAATNPYKVEIDINKLMKEVEEHRALVEELRKNEAEYKKLKAARDAKLNARQPGQLPIQTINPRADVNAIELRSGKTLPEG